MFAKMAARMWRMSKGFASNPCTTKKMTFRVFFFSSFSFRCISSNLFLVELKLLELQLDPQAYLESPDVFLLDFLLEFPILSKFDKLVLVPFILELCSKFLLLKVFFICSTLWITFMNPFELVRLCPYLGKISVWLPGEGYSAAYFSSLDSAADWALF